MRYEFTPAAQRAIATACSGKCGDDELRGPELLLGLLGEDECRAAAMLIRHGLGAAEIQSRWPDLKACVPLEGKSRANGRPSVRDATDPPPISWSAELQAGLAEAAMLLARHPQPISWGTEHLLLSLAAAEGETSHFMLQNGLASDAILQEIAAIYGVESDSTPVEWDDEGVGSLFRGSSREEAAPTDDDGSAGVAKNAPDLFQQDIADTFRILDAAANRGREGLRVVEDFARFVLEDVFLTGELKRLRHDYAACLKQIPAEMLSVCRDTPGDIGTELSTPSEARRDDARHVATVNFKRLEESLRSLEEFGKVIDPAWAAAWEQLRYRTYTLERAVLNTACRAEQLAGARLYVLINGRESVDSFEQLAADLIAAGVHVLQLRDKELSDRVLLARARCLQRLTAGTKTLFIMNDRPDLAALAEADGVHVGQEELSVRDCRRIVGPNRLVGVSTHSIEHARQAVLAGADYLGVGPVFESGTKRFAALPGLEFVRQVAAEIRLPAFAIGGITAENLAQVRAAGLHRVAVSGAAANASHPREAAQNLMRQLECAASPAPAAP